MPKPPPELMGRLKGILSQIMRETDPEKYEELASKMWRVLEDIEHHRTSSAKRRISPEAAG